MMQRAAATLKYLIVLTLMVVLLTACSAQEPEEQETPPVGWDYFETFNPIGSTYDTISSKYDKLEEAGVYDGGVVLQVDGGDLYFGFPRYSADEIQGSDTCTSVYGTLGTVFGIRDAYASDDLEEILALLWQQDYDDSYSASAARDSGNYIVKLAVENINELYEPKTSVAVFSNTPAEEEDGGTQ